MYVDSNCTFISKYFYPLEIVSRIHKTPPQVGEYSNSITLNQKSCHFILASQHFASAVEFNFQ